MPDGIDECGFRCPFLKHERHVMPLSLDPLNVPPMTSQLPSRQSTLLLRAWTNSFSGSMASWGALCGALVDRRRRVYDLLPGWYPGMVRDVAEVAIDSAKSAGACCIRNSNIYRATFRRSTVLPLAGLTFVSNRGQRAYSVLKAQGWCPHESRLPGRWDRNRTCNLRLWSLLPSVPGTATKQNQGLCP